MRDFPKKIKRLLRELAAIAYEEELRRALLPLAAAFDEWKAGKITSGELDAVIHDYHQDPSRKFFSKYNDGALDIFVAHAIVTGILDKSQVPSELFDHLSRAIAFYENQETSS